MRVSRKEVEPLLIHFLAKRARNNEPCPTNASMALDIGAGSESTVVHVLRDLANKGVIVIHRDGHDRIIELPRLGLRTAPKPCRRSAGHIVMKHIEFESLKHVHRDPCFKCGVRADIGCKHQRVA